MNKKLKVKMEMKINVIDTDIIEIDIKIDI